MIPHNLGFCSILEMTNFGVGFGTLWRGTGATGETENTKIIKILNGRIMPIPMIPHVAGLGRNGKFPEIRGGPSRKFRVSRASDTVLDSIARHKG